MDLTSKLSDDWYNKPLDWNDILAGGSLILFALIFLPLYTLIAIVLYRRSHAITGFRYLLSASIADMLLLFNYALWPGTIILLKKHIIPKDGRRLFQAYLDWIWFAMCYHFPLVAWSRFEAICRPYQFRVQKISSTYTLCSLCYIVGLVQSVVTYFQPWYVTFYYEPSAYGMLPEDLQMYLVGGKSLFFISFHSALIIATFILYSCALYSLFKHKHHIQNALFIVHGCTVSNKIAVPTNNKRESVTVSSSIRTETRLIIPCICNAAVFIVGQVVINRGTGEGRWATWLVLVLFSFIAAVEPLLLLIFSRVIRHNALTTLNGLFGCGAKRTVPINAKPMVSRQETDTALRCRGMSKRTKPYEKLRKSKSGSIPVRGQVNLNLNK